MLLEVCISNAAIVIALTILTVTFAGPSKVCIIETNSVAAITAAHIADNSAILGCKSFIA
jgi:hypothetical protein